MTASSPVAAIAELFRRDDDHGVVTLTLNTPNNLNALSLAMIEALVAELDAIANDETARVVVLAGAGPALSAGHDLREMQAHRNDCDRGRSYYVELFERCSALMQAIVALPKPVIAAIEGVATAAGCQLVAACDLAIAGEKARFGLSGVNFGLFCSTPLVAVGRVISRKRAMEMAMTGRLYSAADAERFGLVNRVVPEGRALEEAQALAKDIARQSPTTPGDRQARLLRPDRAPARRGLRGRLAGDDRQPRRARFGRGNGRFHREAPAAMGRRRARFFRRAQAPRRLTDPGLRAAMPHVAPA